ncbi:Fe(3+) dicitrate ABC transporter ATP-binding protein FecE, partial [Brucella pseudogrignonensis]|nr:Fe(3+) dicitrate ABC transporter ATP-binding protein FecE [Brucella pseudogrignonensis]
GAIIAKGAPADIVNAELVEQVFGMPAVIIKDPIIGSPMVVPKTRSKQVPVMHPFERHES